MNNPLVFILDTLIRRRLLSVPRALHPASESRQLQQSDLAGNRQGDRPGVTADADADAELPQSRFFGAARRVADQDPRRTRLRIGITSQYMPGPGYLIGVGLFEMLRVLLTVYWFALIVIIVLSFVAPGTYHPAAELLAQVTEPMLAPARRLIPPLGGLDFSPILVFMILILDRATICCRHLPTPC